MRRIDVIAIGIAVFAAGGVAYLFFETVDLMEYQLEFGVSPY